MTQSIPTRSLLHSLGVVAYVALVSTLMNNAERLFGTGDTVLTGVAFLLLLCASAATVGGLVFGAPAVWFLSGKRREGVLLAVWTVGWLVAEAVAVILLLVVVR